MKPKLLYSVRLYIAALLPLLLTGCLEVEQHPRWINGEYAGKTDQLPYQKNFHHDRMAWTAAIIDRNHLQNEYGRTQP